MKRNVVTLEGYTFRDVLKFLNDMRTEQLCAAGDPDIDEGEVIQSNLKRLKKKDLETILMYFFLSNKT